MCFCSWWCHPSSHVPYAISFAGIHSCAHVGVQCAKDTMCSSVSQELQPVQSLWSARGQPSPLPWTGWKQVSIAPRRWRACCVLAQHHLSFPRWGAGPVGPHPLGLEPSTAKPSPGYENWGQAPTAGTAEEAAVQGSVPSWLYRRGVVLKVKARTNLETLGE